MNKLLAIANEFHQNSQTKRLRNTAVRDSQADSPNACGHCVQQIPVLLVYPWPLEALNFRVINLTEVLQLLDLLGLIRETTCHKVKISWLILEKPKLT